MVQSDTDLILKAQSGSAAAFEELVYRYDRQVLSIALKYTGSSDDAKDIYQDVFIRVFRSLKKFQFKSEFSTWLFRITTNVCLTHKSRIKKREYVSISEEYNEDEPGNVYNLKAEETHSPDVKAASSEISEQINDALESLSPKQKLCFMLKNFEGYKLREIAEMLNCQEGTVKKYLFDAVRKMRTQLKEYSYD